MASCERHVLGGRESDVRVHPNVRATGTGGSVLPQIPGAQVKHWTIDEQEHAPRISGLWTAGLAGFVLGFLIALLAIGWNPPASSVTAAEQAIGQIEGQCLANDPSAGARCIAQANDALDALHANATRRALTP